MKGSIGSELQKKYGELSKLKERTKCIQPGRLKMTEEKMGAFRALKEDMGCS